MSANTDKTYWNQHFKSSPFKDGKNPHPFLEQMLPKLIKGKALDIAMGEGQNATFLAAQGFKVKGFDISDVAVSHAQNLALERGVDLDAKVADLDLFIMGLMEYDTIIMLDFKPSSKRFYSELQRSLKQGGTLLISGELSSNLSMEDFGANKSVKNYYYINELLQNLKGLQIVFYQEISHNGKEYVQCLAKRPLDKDAARYNLFDMHSEHKAPQKTAHEQALDSLFKK
ncbi:MAG: class I SAM-dependent methyltransferase [Oligoflexales bacterium]|nr:class I SAM-dependent methyltransferase [Oligoflexales bacterium]